MTDINQMEQLVGIFTAVQNQWTGKQTELFAAHVAAAVATALDDGLSAEELMKHMEAAVTHSLATYRRQRILKQAREMTS